MHLARPAVAGRDHFQLVPPRDGNDGTVMRFGWKAAEQISVPLLRRDPQRGDGSHERSFPK